MYSFQIYICSFACILSNSVLCFIWLFSLTKQPYVGGVFQPLRPWEMGSFAFFCLAVAVFHLLCIFAHCHFMPQWALRPYIVDRMTAQMRRTQRRMEKEEEKDGRDSEASTDTVQTK